MQNRDFEIWADQYLENELSAEEIFEFEKELKTNNKLQEILKIQKNAREILKDKKLLKLKNTLDKIHRRKQNKRSFLILKPNAKWAAAALILGLIIYFVFDHFQNKKLTSKLFNEHYQAYRPDTGTQFLHNTKDTASFTKALSLYIRKEFKESYSLFEKILANNPKNYHAHFYYSLCAIELDLLFVAEEQLLFLIENRIHQHVNKSKWYLIMVYLKKGLKNKVRELLYDLIEDETVYKNDAKKILNSLQA